MLGARRGIPLLAISVAALIGGCTTIAPISTPGASTAPVGSSAVSGVPTVAPPSPSPAAILPTSEPSVTPETPSVGPTDGSTQEPPVTPTPDATAASGQPNLVATKFTAPNPVQVNTTTEAKVAIKNKGSSEAGPFSVVMSVAKSDGTPVSKSDQFETKNPLAAGATKQVVIPFTVSEPGDYTLTVKVDNRDEVVESNEQDNSTQIDVTATALPNLTIEANSFNVVLEQGYDRLKVVLVNTGTATIGTTWYVRFTWTSSDGTQSGEFGEFELDGPITPGKRVDLDIPVPSIGPGDFVGHVFADSKGQIVETDETDNQANSDFTNPQPPA